MADRVEVDLPCEFSDGLSSKWPQRKYVWAPADTLYVKKLADLGKELIEGSKNGERYIFKKLPEGYRAYTKTRKDGKIKDRYVFGHPKGKFDSPIKFYVHFKWLMRGGVGDCTCVNCRTHAMRNTSLPSVAPTTPAPEPDVNDLKAQLERFANIFEENPENLSEVQVPWEGPPPWGPHKLLDGQLFKDTAAKYRTLPSFLPRKGELVIFYSDEEPNCRFEDMTQQFKVFDEDSGDFVGFPAWKAGVITTEPEEQLGHEDLSPPPYDRLEVINKSYRIELYPDPDTKDKRLSNEGYLVPLNRIRPLSMYHELLSGVSQNQWHETIHNALKVMNTVCFVDPIGFAGKWFSYSIRCRGVWIGPELFINGDAVRLLPAGGNDNQVDQVIIINRIDHRFENDDIHDERSSIVVTGPVITVNKIRSFQDTPFTAAEEQELPLPASTAGYSWYPIDVSTDGHPPEANYERFLDDWQEIPMSFIVGRLYDSEAMKALLNIGNFDVGGLGMKQARQWAKQHRPDMKVNTRQGWILTVDRIQALGIETLNGRAVGRGVDRDNIRPGNGNHPPQSTKSVVTGRPANWSETEDENAEKFISDVISGNVLPTAEEGMDEDSADEDQKLGQNGDSLDRPRPLKRPRL